MEDGNPFQERLDDIAKDILILPKLAELLRQNWP
jgi:hypothetical protein